jgi:uncharacterized protein (TIGR02266 family)
MTSERENNGPDSAADPVDHRVTVDLEFTTLREFREEMAPYLNHGGLFIKTGKPYARGTAVRFRFVMPEGFVLAQGTGVVASIRTPEKDPDLEPGMVVWFEEVERQSREVIGELVDFHIAIGRDPFDIGLDTGGAGEIPTDALGGGAPLPPGPVTQEPLRRDEGPSSASKPSCEVLPVWLSDVADEHDIDLSLENLSEDETPEISIAEPPEPTGQDFEISMIDDSGEPDPTPVRSPDESSSDLTITPRDHDKPSTGLRLWPLAAAVLVTISIGGWWLVMKPSSSQIPETSAASERAAPTPRPTAVAEEPGELSSVKPQEVSEPAQAARANPPPTTQPATRIVDVAVARVGDATVVDIRGNGGLSEARLRVSALDDPPRVWLRIRGIEDFYRPSEIAVGSPEVSRIRVGHHPEESPVSLWIVLDLADGSAVVRDTSVSGDTIRVSVGRR